jgi:hypothetical protein
MTMRITTIAAVCGLLALPATAAAQEPSPENFKNAAKYCKALKKAAGDANFKAMFGGGKNAYGKCVSKAARLDQKQESEAKSNASKQCKAEEAADPVAFKARYGTGKNGKNAHGKCVSQKAKENKAAADKAENEKVNAAETCRAEQKQNPQAFAEKYGTNENNKNAFGKCVSKTAKANNQAAAGGTQS